MRVYDRTLPPRSVEISASQLIARGPCLIVSLSVSGDGAAGLGIIYDGANANGRRKATLQTGSDTSFSPFICCGIECETGIYATVDAATTFLRIEYYPANEVEVRE